MGGVLACGDMSTPLAPRPLAPRLLLALALLAAAARAGGRPPDATPGMTGKTAPQPVPTGKPRLAFLELTPGPEVTKEVAQAAGEVLVVALADTGKFDVILELSIQRDL